jgi:hypothetical protein
MNNIFNNAPGNFDRKAIIHKNIDYAFEYPGKYDEGIDWPDKNQNSIIKCDTLYDFRIALEYMYKKNGAIGFDALKAKVDSYLNHENAHANASELLFPGSHKGYRISIESDGDTYVYSFAIYWRRMNLKNKFLDLIMSLCVTKAPEFYGDALSEDDMLDIMRERSFINQSFAQADNFLQLEDKQIVEQYRERTGNELPASEIRDMISQEISEYKKLLAKAESGELIGLSVPEKLDLTKYSIVIDSPRGTHGSFEGFNNLAEHPLKDIIFPMDYGHIQGYINENGDHLGVFVGTGSICGYLVINSYDISTETKVFVNVTSEELLYTRMQFENIENHVGYLTTENFQEFMSKFKAKK